MKCKKILPIVGIMVSTLNARELRTPLTMPWGSVHKRLPLPFDEENKTKWFLDTWIGGYHRKANTAFCESCDTSDCKKSPFSQLIFSKEAFKGEEAFANAQLPETILQDGTSRKKTISPLLALATLSPRFVYRENGVIFGLETATYLTKDWRIGGRLSLPVRIIEVTRMPGPRQGPSDLGGITVDQLAIERTETVGGNQVKTFAFRLDFLSMLPLDCVQVPAVNFPIVNYHHAGHNNNITITNQDVTNNPALVTANDDRNPVTVIRKEDGSIPIETFGLTLAIAQALPDLSGDGTSVENNERARFIHGTNYIALGNNQALQGELWIVPTVNGANLVGPARIIRRRVNELIGRPLNGGDPDGCIDPTAEAAFERCGICFASQKRKGIGDLDTEAFAQYFFKENTCYVEGIVGVRFPTAAKLKEPGLVLKQPTGNNGHFEVKIGGQTYLKASRWLQVHADLSYHIVCKNTERVLASFEKATIKNLGSDIPATVSWEYILGHVDASFVPFGPDNLGLTVGYEWYYKKQDSVCFEQSYAQDCLGFNQLLDPSVSEKITQVRSHKIRTELFYDHKSKTKSFDVSTFFGFSAIVGGCNVPRERDWHGGIRVAF